MTFSRPPFMLLVRCGLYISKYPLQTFNGVVGFRLSHSYEILCPKKYLKATYRGVFRTQSNIYDRAFLQKNR